MSTMTSSSGLLNSCQHVNLCGLWAETVSFYKAKVLAMSHCSEVYEQGEGVIRTMSTNHMVWLPASQAWFAEQ